MVFANAPRDASDVRPRIPNALAFGVQSGLIHRRLQIIVSSFVVASLGVLVCVDTFTVPTASLIF